MANSRGRRDFWTVDAETDPFHHCADAHCLKCAGIGRIPQPFIWGAYNGSSAEYIEFGDAAALAEFFSTKKTICYAHNGGRFDYHYLRDYINTDENIMVIAGRLSKFKVGACEFRDSLNIFQQTRLKDFGNKLEIDYEKMELEHRDNPNVRAEISCYLRVDCVDLWNHLDRYFREYGRGLTQAGAAMRVWSRMAKVKPPRQTKEQFKRYKPFYYGGRVQCFKQGVSARSFSVVDINSAYPFAMLSRHPFSTDGIVSDVLPCDMDIGKSLVRLHCVADGAFPHRSITGELTFPNDGQAREYCITGWELLAALEFDAISKIKILEVHTFPLSIDFAEYVHTFYNKRKEAKARDDKAEDIFCKLFLNSLYGKFGSNPAGAHNGEDEDNPADGYQEYLLASDESIAQWMNPNQDGGAYTSYKPWGARTLMIRPLPEFRHTYYNVATAASITGFVRALLFRASRQCGGLIYMDTDSITAEAVTALDIGKELGQWKLELKCERYAVAGKKNYAFEASDHSITDYHAYTSRLEKTGHWKIASKGARLTPEEMVKVASGEKVLYRPESPTYTITRQKPRFINREIRMTELAQI